MGTGELIGMRFILWERDERGDPPTGLPPAVFNDMMRFITNALAPEDNPAPQAKRSTDD